MTMILVTYYGLPVQPVPFDIDTVKYGEFELARRGWGAMTIGCSSAGHLGSMNEVLQAADEEGAEAEFIGWAYSVKNRIGKGVKYAWAMRDGTLSHDLHTESVHEHFDDALLGLMAAYQSPQTHGIHLLKEPGKRLKKWR